MRAPDRLPYSSLAPTVVALAMAGSGLGAWDYHLGLAVAPVSAWAAAVAMGRWLQRIGGLQGPLACILLGPLAVAAAVAPWQPACNVVDSAALWALGPAAAGLWGLGIGALAALAPSRGGARAVLAALYAGAALPAAAHFLQSPQIDAYLPHAGHVAGALYEDAVAVGWRDVAYRLADLAWLIPVIAVASELRTRDQPWSLAALRRLARGHRAIGWALWTAALAMATAAWLAGEQRWRTPQAGFEAALPVRRVVGGPGGVAVTVHGPRGARWRQPLDQLRDDVAFRHRQLTQWFGHASTGIELFVWPDAASKRAWTGAHRVEMAKPWLRQIHMVLPDDGSSTLTHELAHVFAAGWADNPLGVALGRGWIPDALLVEGVAVAAEWPVRGGLDPHGWTSAARTIGVAPPLHTLRSSGAFLRMNADLAYTLAGSLARYLADHCGRQGLARAYRAGDLAQACDRPLDDVLRSWAAFVDDPARPRPSAADLERARARFEPPGLFDRPCALAAGRCRDRAAADHKAGNDRSALDRWQGLLQTLPQTAGQRDPSVVFDAAAARAAAGHARDALAALTAWQAAQRARPAAARPNRLTLAVADSLRGDLAWQAGDRAAADAAWAAAAEAPVDEATARTLAAKRHLADRLEAAPLLRHLLCAGGPHARAEAILDAVPAALAGDPVAMVLWARRALRFGDEAAAVQVLEHVLPALREGHPLMYAEAARVLGRALARSGRCAELAALGPALTTPGQLSELRERCALANRAAPP